MHALCGYSSFRPDSSERTSATADVEIKVNKLTLRLEVEECHCTMQFITFAILNNYFVISSFFNFVCGGARVLIGDAWLCVGISAINGRLW